ncbi:MAG: DUF192 domain-containing protein [Phycisphaerales bacterium]
MASHAGLMGVGIVATLAAAVAQGCGEGNQHAANGGSSARAEQANPKPDPKPGNDGSKPAAGVDGSAGDTKPRDGAPVAAAVNETLTLDVGGKKFKLELAITEPVRMKGLGQRKEIAADGGMLFAFRDSDVRVQRFVMRDCLVDIDIIYLDGSGRVLAMHTMKAEKPRDPDGSEGKVGDFSNFKYESRLPSYSSRFPSQFVIELKGGTLPSLKIKEGDKIEGDWTALKKRCK